MARTRTNEIEVVVAWLNKSTEMAGLRLESSLVLCQDFIYIYFSHAALLPPGRAAAGGLAARQPAPHLREFARPRHPGDESGGQPGGSGEGNGISDDRGGNPFHWVSGSVSTEVLF